MGVVFSLIPELEEVVQRGSREKRRETLRRITALFLDGASRYNDAHVDLFDEVFGLLIEEIETKARAELSNHLAPVGNAPVNVLRKLANDDDITVAGPVLKLARAWRKPDLVDVASNKGQAHLRAISARRALGEAVTDVLVRRGDRDVARRVADNPRRAHFRKGLLQSRQARRGRRHSGREGRAAAGYSRRRCSAIC